MATKMTREEIRKRIDTLDSQLVMLFAARMELCKQLAVAKKELGLPVEDKQREEDKLSVLREMVGDDKDLHHYIEELYGKIFELSKEYQTAVQISIGELLTAAAKKAEELESQRDTGIKFGLVGGHLEHSLSPKMHHKIADALGIEYEYELYEVEAWDLEKFMDETDLDAFNVTIPHKKEIMKYCSVLSDQAKRIGAVNTVVREADGWHGYNTDYAGFKYIVDKSGYDVSGVRATVLGAGGASATAQTVLRDMGAKEVAQMTHADLTWLEELSQQGRDMEIAGIDAVAGAQLVVNTTPVGMYPHAGEYPIDLANIWRVDAVIDVIYNPARTTLMMDAESRDKITMGGMGMLVVQAIESLKICLGKAGKGNLDMAAISKELDGMRDDLIESLEKEQENVVLIGMPGSGKSTVGQLVADATGKTFIDTDEEIEKREGKTIPEIFESVGEAGFREMERKVLDELGQKSGQVIATGGGCVTIPENYRALHQNGRIIWIQRRLEDLETKGRPISESRPLKDIYEERKEMYEKFADFAIDGDIGEEMAFRNVMEALRR